MQRENEKYEQLKNRSFMKMKKIGVRFTWEGEKNRSSSNSRGGLVDYYKPNKRRKEFPIYVQLTYDGNNTKFKFGDEEYTKEEFNSEKTQNNLLLVENELKEIIRKEVDYLGREFSLRGIAIRYDKYKKTVLEGIFSLANEHLMSEASEIFDDKDLTAKEFFFLSGIAGVGLQFIMKGIKLDYLLEFFTDYPEMGKQVLSKKNYNRLFNNKICSYFKSILDFQKDQNALSEITILEFLSKNKLEMNENEEKLTEYLWQYITKMEE